MSADPTPPTPEEEAVARALWPRAFVEPRSPMLRQEARMALKQARAALAALAPHRAAERARAWEDGREACVALARKAEAALREQAEAVADIGLMCKHAAATGAVGAVAKCCAALPNPHKQETT